MIKLAWSKFILESARAYNVGIKYIEMNFIRELNIKNGEKEWKVVNGNHVAVRMYINQ